MTDKPTDKTPEIIDLETLPPDSDITITINTDIYIRLQQLLLEALPYKDIADFQANLKKVHDGDSKEGLAYHMHTILYILNLVEDAAKKGDKIVKKKFDLTAGKLVED